MRVGLIAPPWAAVPPDGYGGTEAMLDNLARGLNYAGCDVTLYTVGESTCPVERRWLLERAEGERMGSSVPELRHVLAAYEELNGRVDVIHDHTLIGPVLACEPGITDVPVVTTNHGPFNEELNDLYQRLSGRVSVVAISHSQAATARGVAIARVIHHGVDLACFPEPRSARGDELLFLGRMAAEKGAHRAIRVARRAGKRLVIAAKMRERQEFAYFEKYVEPHLGDDVEFVGEVAGARKYELLANAAALVNPIMWPEPFGMVMIEAMACGTPVVGFRQGAAPEIVVSGVSGFLVDDEDEMVNAIGQVQQIDPQACRERVRRRFSHTRMAAVHRELYAALIRSRGRRRVPLRAIAAAR